MSQHKYSRSDKKFLKLLEYQQRKERAINYKNVNFLTKMLHPWLNCNHIYNSLTRECIPQFHYRIWCTDSAENADGNEACKAEGETKLNRHNVGYMYLTLQ